MVKQNCWEFKKCGREPGGENISEFGVCPATTNAFVDGVNEGTNGGRICWAVAGMFCGERMKGTFANELLSSCLTCDFFNMVLKEEVDNNFYLFTPDQIEAV
jgi:hypothetical protein